MNMTESLLKKIKSSTTIKNQWNETIELEGERKSMEDGFDYLATKYFNSYLKNPYLKQYGGGLNDIIKGYTKTFSCRRDYFKDFKLPNRYTLILETLGLNVIVDRFLQNKENVMVWAMMKNKITVYVEPEDKTTFQYGSPYDIYCFEKDLEKIGNNIIHRNILVKSDGKLLKKMITRTDKNAN